jgi:hypothetical protein
MKDNLIIPALALSGLLQVAAVAYANPDVASKELLKLHDGGTLSTFQDRTGPSACRPSDAADVLGDRSHY